MQVSHQEITVVNQPCTYEQGASQNIATVDHNVGIPLAILQ